MKSPGLLAGGITLAVVGSASVPLGVLMVLFGSNSGGRCFSGPCSQPDNTPLNVFGGLAIGLGAASVLASVPMIVVGARSVPVEVLAGGPGNTPGMSVRVTFE